MKAYIISIIGATILSAVASILTPDAMRKYVSVITGFIIISVLISPFSSDFSASFLDDFEFDSTLVSEGENLMYEKVRAELETRIKNDIIQRVSEEFSQTVDATATVKTNSKGEIENVERIELKGKKNDNITERLKFVYGTEEVIWIE